MIRNVINLKNEECQEREKKESSDIYLQCHLSRCFHFKGVLKPGAFSFL